MSDNEPTAGSALRTLAVVSLVVAEEVMHENAVELGWIDE